MLPTSSAPFSAAPSSFWTPLEHFGVYFPWRTAWLEGTETTRAQQKAAHEPWNHNPLSKTNELITNKWINVHLVKTVSDRLRGAERLYLLLLWASGRILPEPSWCLAHTPKHEFQFSLANAVHLSSHREIRLGQLCPPLGTKSRIFAGSFPTDRCQQVSHSFIYSHILASSGIRLPHLPNISTS